MTKKQFIALADAIREHNARPGLNQFTPDQLTTLCHVFQWDNPRFKKTRWLDYIEGKCGKNGGALK